MPASCARSLKERRAHGGGKRGSLFSPGGLVTTRTREPAGSAQPRTAPGRTTRKGRWVSVGGRTRQLRKLGVPHAASEYIISPRGHWGVRREGSGIFAVYIGLVRWYGGATEFGPVVPPVDPLRIFCSSRVATLRVFRTQGQRHCTSCIDCKKSLPGPIFRSTRLMRV